MGRLWNSEQRLSTKLKSLKPKKKCSDEVMPSWRADPAVEEVSLYGITSAHQLKVPDLKMNNLDVHL